MTTLRIHGGKSYLAARIVELMPAHTRYCEPFFGGGAVLFARSGEGVAEWVNDLNYELTEFWRVLGNSDRFEVFNRAIQTIPFSQVEFEDAELPILIEGDDMRTSINRAVAFFIRNRQSRQGLGRDFATPTRRLRRGMNENVSAWLSAVDGLPEVHARLRRVEIRNQDAVKFIKELDSPETFYFVDPPYVHETRTTTGEYQHEMTDTQHIELLDTLAAIEGKFLLSGYPSAMYDSAARLHGWRVVDVEIDNKASGRRVKEKKVERMWLNYETGGQV
jgi:DNA adenine methylase